MYAETMIRSLLLTGLSLLLSVASAGKTSASGSVHVSGYTTKNGTVVAPYYRRAPGTAGTSYTYPAYRLPQTTQVFSSCAEARAAGRWNILATETDYSPALDRDSDGIACEAGSDGASNGRDPDPVDTTVSAGPVVSSTTLPTATTARPAAVTPWDFIGQTYPEWLASKLAWSTDVSGCVDRAAAREQAFLSDGSGTTPAWRGTVGYTAGLDMDSDQHMVDTINTVNGVQSGGRWVLDGAYSGEWVSPGGENQYLIELRTVSTTRATVCITTYLPR